MQVISNTQFSDQEHYAIIVFNTRSIYHEGDERSRTNPGHGYPAYTEKVKEFEYFSFPKTDVGKESWEKMLKDLYLQEKDIVGFISSGKVKISKEVKIS